MTAVPELLAVLENWKQSTQFAGDSYRRNKSGERKGRRDGSESKDLIFR